MDKGVLSGNFIELREGDIVFKIVLCFYFYYYVIS